jgi:hypothetical protein
MMAPGVHVTRVDGRGDHGEELSAGIYFYRLETITGARNGKIAIVK